MSFIFNQMDFDEMFPTSEALRFEWEHLSGLDVESLEVPGMERRRFLETDRPRTKIEYTVILHSDTEQGAEDALDQFMIHIDPASGPQRLIDKDYPEWYHMAAVSEEITWERLTWDCATRGYRYRGKVVFETYGDASQRLVDEGSFEVDGELVIIPHGTTRSWPRWEFSERLSAGQSVKFTVSPVLGAPRHEVTVAGPLDEGQTMVLDYDTMQFAVWEGTQKVASLVNRMSTLDRPELHPILGEVQVSASVRRQVEYEWAGTPHASESIKRVDGVEVARNLVFNPSYEETVDSEDRTFSAGWRTSTRVLNLWAVYGDSSWGLVADAGASAYTYFGKSVTAKGSWIAFNTTIQASAAGGGGTRYFSARVGSRVPGSDPYGYGDFLPEVSAEPGDIVEVGGSYKLPDGHTQVLVLVYVNSQEARRAGPKEGWVIRTDGFHVASADTEAEALAQMETYFDGDMPGGYQDEGATALFYPNSRRQ